MSKLGIVTVLYKSESVLEEFFLSVGIQNFKDYTLYIIDNSPTDESKKLVYDYSNQYNISEKVVYLPSEENIGVAAGNNVGIKKALEEGCDYVLLSNNDILIKDKHLFDNILNEAIHNKYKILIPKIHFYDSNEIWFISGYVQKFRAKCFHIHNYEIDNGQYDYLKSCEYAPTCFMLFNKEVFDEVGLMDEKYFVYYDDTDFLWRCKLKNIPVNIFTKAVIEHKEGRSTGGQTSDFSFYYYTRNRFYFSSKINKQLLVKYASYLYIFIVSLLRSFKHKKTKLYIRLVTELLRGDEFKRINKF